VIVRNHRLGASHFVRAIAAPVSASNKSLPTLRKGAQSKSTTHITKYRGYRLEIAQVCKGWRASIYSRGASSPLLDSPTNLEKSRKEDIIALAKQIIDTRFGLRLL
jgi:hypothetical protein